MIDGDRADWQIAEERAAQHMRTIGFVDATLTPPGADGGVDVRATGAIAQVKHFSTPVGIAEVQRLRGTAAEGETPLFYASAGYTTSALGFAEKSGMALFTLTPSGAEPATSVAVEQNVRVVDDLNDAFRMMMLLYQPLKALGPHLQLWLVAMQSLIHAGDLDVTGAKAVAKLCPPLPEEYVSEFWYEWFALLQDLPENLLEPALDAVRTVSTASGEASKLINAASEGASPAENARDALRILREVVSLLQAEHERLATMLPVPVVSIPVVGA